MEPRLKGHVLRRLIASDAWRTMLSRQWTVKRAARVVC